MKFSRFVAHILAILLSASMADPVAAAVVQSTAFTYQGQLNAGGTLPSGQTYQFTFTLYDAATAGNVVGTPIQQAILVGNGGLFTTDLDFGQIFNGTQYWLDIQVGTTTLNEQELAARQPINAVPVAQYALNAPPPTFAEFYHTDAGTSVVVPSGDAVPFPNLGPSAGSPIYAFPGPPPDFLTTQFQVVVTGIYEVTFEISTADAGGDALAIFVNGFSTVAHAQVGQSGKTQVGKFLVPLVAGDIISVVNIGLFDLHLQANTVGATDANLVIKLLH